ncbi:Ribosomal protein S18 acetylase RimI [Geosmithia morbida]|uniref:Ribosomal protein S18 acetylase RimI n=1 Tax=Geosmithia morbida TaxID=1094350 RepID=A0A9P5D4G1_9HYPO|nr:Ribosomal protein S18 acetylase RimI [Geosmithia morbida]KAF4126017.1 Ribosomal protein S18 acetylase RimI [Geosmithia morbida]
MPALLDDPASPPIYRVSGQPPFPDPAMPQLPLDIVPRQVTLRDRQTVATIVPLASASGVPESLCAYLCDQLNKEIEGGDTYPMMELFTVESFTRYWFQNFGAVMLLGSLSRAEDVVEGKDWSRECLGSFYIKPNYPGRSSHVCNAGFLVTDASRNRGVGRLMGEAYIDYAPRLGYTYSVFNLVYETNVASCRIWDALGFKRIGRVKGCGNLRSHPDRLIDAIIYGRDLAPGDSDDLLVSEERFDKIKYYLKYGKYPNGADRAEKSRLRSAATSYKLLDGDKLMLKGKEVISDPALQLDIARAVHAQHHGGINKTTASIAEKYHWSRIKETVSDIIRNCPECKDSSSGGGSGGAVTTTTNTTATTSSSSPSSSEPTPPTTAPTLASLFTSHQEQGHEKPNDDDDTMSFADPTIQTDMTVLHETIPNPRTQDEYADPSQLSSIAPETQSDREHDDHDDHDSVATQAVVDHDLEMLIDDQDDDVGAGVTIGNHDTTANVLVESHRGDTAGTHGDIIGHDDNLLLAAQGHRTNLYHDHDDGLGFGGPS